jgi:cytochrome bd-type quinol oxidase subunit 2
MYAFALMLATLQQLCYLGVPLCNGCGFPATVCGQLFIINSDVTYMSWVWHMHSFSLVVGVANLITYILQHYNVSLHPILTPQQPQA